MFNYANYSNNKNHATELNGAWSTEHNSNAFVVVSQILMNSVLIRRTGGDLHLVSDF